MPDVVDGYYLLNAMKSFFRIMFVFICFSSIVLLIAPSVFGKIAQRLQEKHGVKKEFLPWLEDDKIVIDHFLYNHRKIIGTLAIIVSLILFLALR